VSGVEGTKGEAPRTECGVVVHAGGGFYVVRVLMRGPQVPITCPWQPGMEVPLLVEFEIPIGFEGTAAVEGQLAVIERNTIECWIGLGLFLL